MAFHRITKIISSFFTQRRKTDTSPVTDIRKFGVTVLGSYTVDTPPVISMYEGSSIIIEDGVSLISSPTTNPSGILHPCTLVTQTPDATIHLGKDSGMSGATICCRKKIYVGEYVGLGANVMVFDNDFHPTNPYLRKFHNEENIPCEEVIIDDFAWIGANSIILKGVHIGYGAVVGAGSVVTTDIPPLTIFAGNPAKYVKDVELTDEQFSVIFKSREKPNK